MVYGGETKRLRGLKMHPWYVACTRLKMPRSSGIFLATSRSNCEQLIYLNQ